VTLPLNISVVRVRGYWFDQAGGGAPLTLTFTPQASNLTNLGAFAFVKTDVVTVTPDPATAYFYADLIATNDPDLTPFAWVVTPQGQPSFTIEVDYLSPMVNVGGSLVMQAAWLVDCATIVAPTPTNTYYTSDQTNAAIATAFSGFSGGSGVTLTPTAVKSSAYTAAVGDFVPVDTTSGAVTITLPTAPADKAQIGIKHVIQGSTNVVTVACGGSDKINKVGGSTTFSLSTLNQGIWFEYKLSTGIWYVLTSDLALSQLDARYNRTISVPTATGVAATDWANISAATTLATSVVAAGGRPVVEFPSCPVSGGTLTPYRIGNHSIPIIQGVVYRGVLPAQAQVNTASPGYLPDGEYTFVAGTVLEGDGTAPGFWDGHTDQASIVSATWGQAQIAGVEITGFGLQSFSHGIRSGAVNSMGLVWSKLDQLYARACGWGFWLANYQHLDIGLLEVCSTTVGDMYFASLCPASSLVPGNSYFRALYAKHPNGGANGNAVRGVVFDAQSSGVAAGLTVGRIDTVQVNAFNRVARSQTATFTSSSSSVVLDANGANFAVGMPVTFATANAPFVAGVSYYVLTQSGNTLTLVTSKYSATAITATASGTATINTNGYHGFEVATNGGLVTADIGLLDVEGSTIAGSYFENASRVVVGNATGGSYVVRGSDVFIRACMGTVVDLDTSSFRSEFHGHGTYTFPNFVPSGIRLTGPANAAVVSLGAARLISTSLWTPGQYRTSDPLSYSSQTLSGNQFFCSLLDVPGQRTLTAIGVNVTTAGAAGTVIRLGLYTAGTDGRPSALVQDFGTVVATAIAYVEVSGLSLTLTEGAYWVGAAAQGVTTPSPVVSAIVPRILGNSLGQSACTGNSMSGLFMNGVTGALASTFTVSGQTGNVPSVAVKL
jgi:hypothetical protein